GAAGRRELVADGHAGVAATRHRGLAAGTGDPAAVGGGLGAGARAGRARRDRGRVPRGAGPAGARAGGRTAAAGCAARLPRGLLPAAAVAGAGLLPCLRGPRRALAVAGYSPLTWKRSASSIAGKCSRCACRRAPLRVVVVTTSMSPHSLTDSPRKSMIAPSPE